MHAQKFYPTTILYKDDAGNQLTVAMALEMIDAFLGYLVVTFNVNTEPYSTAVKVANAIINALKNRPTKTITEQDLKVFVDVWELAAKQRYPNDTRQIAFTAMFCKAVLSVVYKKN